MTTPDRDRAQRLLDVVFALDPLSELPRTGWLLRGVRPCESLADHSYGVALVAMLLVDALRADGVEVDGERVLRMALVHDAPEARTGDVPMPEKTAALDAALTEHERRLATQLLPPAAAALFVEYDTGATVEARVVKTADKIQMMCKALAYERAHRGALDEFWASPRNFDDRGLAPAREVFAALLARAGRALPRE
jgi:putative hydrolase of HD superfamily